MLMRHGSIFNVNGGDPFSARLDDVFAAVCDAHEAQGVNAGHIACPEPIVLVHSTCFMMLQKRWSLSPVRLTISQYSVVLWQNLCQHDTMGTPVLGHCSCLTMLHDNSAECYRCEDYTHNMLSLLNDVSHSVCPEPVVLMHSTCLAMLQDINLRFSLVVGKQCKAWLEL